MSSPRSSLQRLAAALPLLLAGCGADPASEAPAEPVQVPMNTDAVVDFAVSHQTIAGFGASSAWTAPNLTEELADQLFSMEKGIGLSLLRLRIDPSGETVEVESARKATARGAGVWASPWSPPGEWKTNGSATDGGSLLPEYITPWAERLAAFARAMADRGVPLRILSAQNEPNYVAEWETCEWSEEELTAFIRDELGPALEREGVNTPILAPETINWDSIRRYGDRLLSDPAARRFIGAVATHSYGGAAFRYGTPAKNGRQLWQTEVSVDTELPYDPGVGNALRVAKMIHEHLAIAEVSAWHYWWIIPRSRQNPDNAGLTNGTTLARRAHALGNWSKFVRPGFVRVETTTSPQPGVFVTAFRDTASPRLAIIAVNENGTEVSQRFAVTGSEAVSLRPWLTSEEHALVEQPAITVEPHGFTHVFPARSLTTLVGMLDGSDPAPFSVADPEQTPGIDPASAPEPSPPDGTAGRDGGIAGAGSVFDEGSGSGTACVCRAAGTPAKTAPSAIAVGAIAPVLLLLRRRRRAGSSMRREPGPLAGAD